MLYSCCLHVFRTPIVFLAGFIIVSFLRRFTVSTKRCWRVLSAYSWHHSLCHRCCRRIHLRRQEKVECGGQLYSAIMLFLNRPNDSTSTMSTNTVPQSPLHVNYSATRVGPYSFSSRSRHLGVGYRPRWTKNFWLLHGSFER
jgi:hypothetical protein